MIIKNNLLNLNDYQKIKKTMSSANFPWYFNESSLHGEVGSGIKEKNIFQFTHTFLQDGIISSNMNILEPLLPELNAVTFFRIKANLNTQTSKIIETGEHTDEDKRFTSAVFFLNSCNGYCKIDNKKIKSEDNKMVIFNSNKKHTGSTCTDVDRRMLINFVYIKNN